MEMIRRIKPCPFCGGSAGVYELKGGKFPRYFTACVNGNCIASEVSIFGKKFWTRNEAIEAWNRRVKSSEKG